MPKPFFTYDQQINKLKSKGMQVNHEIAAKEILHQYGYFALISGYKDIFKNKMTHDYEDGTKFEDIVALYQFDEQLRELTFRYLLHIERHMRSSISYSFCNVFGEKQSMYLSRRNYDISTIKKQDGVDKLIKNYLSPIVRKKTDYDYIEHNKLVHGNVPLWVLVHALTFGTLSKMYAFADSRVQTAISKEFIGVSESQLKQLLEVLTDFRNVCAHNERLFTHRCSKHDIPDFLIHKKLGIIKNGNQYVCGKRDYFSIMIAFRYLIPNEEFKEYKARLTKLIDTVVERNNKISESDLLHMMGLPGNWKKITSYKIV